MFKMLNLFLLALIVSVGFLISCSSDLENPTESDDQVLEVGDSFQGAKVVKIVDLPDCDSTLEGAIFYILDDSLFKYCDGESYSQIDLQGQEGTSGTDGTSLNWLGSFEDDPADPQAYDVYYNSTESSVYLYADEDWEVLVSDGINGTDGTNGTDGIDGTSCLATSITSGIEISCAGTIIDTLLNGQNGVPGTDGETGDQGVPGTPGNDGTIGDEGVAGEDGSPGNDGEPGDDGESCTAVSVTSGLEISCAAVVIDTILHGTDGQNAVSLNVSGTIAPGQSLTLTHNLNRSDLTFDGQFIHEGFIHSYTESKDIFTGLSRKDSTQFNASVAYSNTTLALQDGNFAVVFVDQFDAAYGKFMIIDAVGNEVLGKTLFNDSNTFQIAGTVLNNGNFVIAYTNTSTARVGTFIIYDASGNIVKNKTFFNASEAYLYESSLTVLANGNFVIAYRDKDDSDIGKYIIYDEDGNEVKATTTINNSGTAYLSTTTLGNGNFVIACQDQGNGSYGVFYILNDTGGVVLDSVLFHADPVYDVTTTTLSNGNFVIAFRDGSTSMFIIVNAMGSTVLGPTEYSDMTSSTVCLATLPGREFAIFYAEEAPSQMGIMKVYDEGGTVLKETITFNPTFTSAVSPAVLTGGNIAIAYRPFVTGDAGTGSYVVYGKSEVALEKVSDNEVKLWNYTSEPLELMLSVNQ